MDKTEVAESVDVSQHSELDLLNRIKYFQTVQLWPFGTDINPQGWLGNFDTSDRPLALQLLKSFLYFPDSLVREMFRASFERLGEIVIRNKKNAIASQTEWERFKNNLIICRVTGEEPNDSDSAFLFSRYARQVCGVSEAQIKPHEAAIDDLVADPKIPLVFVDDFVGSGNQLITTWRRNYYSRSLSRQISFRDLSRLHGKLEAYYCPVICTSYGLSQIQSACPDVKVFAANTLGDEYSAIDPKSLVWGAHNIGDGVSFLKRISLGIGMTEDGKENDWRGYRKLALSMAFEHGVPDATLPIYYWTKNNWIPLIHRK